jgi:N-acyl homoserine lactone hydrolase
MKTARRMWALHGANIIVDVGLLVAGQHGSLTVPVPAFLIEHDRG